MNPIRRAQHAIALVLASFVTLGVMSTLNTLAAPDAGAATQLVAAASAPSV